MIPPDITSNEYFCYDPISRKKGSLGWAQYKKPIYCEIAEIATVLQ